MDERQREIDRRIRRARRAMLFQSMREHSLLILIGSPALSEYAVASLGFGVLWNSAPDRLEATVLGKIVNDGGLQATRRGTQFHKETVQLPSGIRITINLPEDDAVRPEEPLRIEIHEKDFGPLHQVSYRFAGYADEAVKQPG